MTPTTPGDNPRCHFIQKPRAAIAFCRARSVIEMPARERARALVDPGSFRELLGPFDRLESPWLPLQGIVPQSDDGVVVVRGQVGGRPAVILAIEGAFQGGGMGEVSASKMAAALELARRDSRTAPPSSRCFCSRPGACACRRPIWARPGSPRFMPRSSPCAGMCPSSASSPAWSVVSAAWRSLPACAAIGSSCRRGRLELNGPEVIEQEAGIDELDSYDRRLIWSLMGGEQRYATGFADALIEDDADTLRHTIEALAARGVPARHRSEMVDEYRRRLAKIDPARPPDGAELRRIWATGETP